MGEILRMGSICSQNSSSKVGGQPPQDLADLLALYEKNKSENSYWVDQFTVYLNTLDKRSKQMWRERLLNFVLLSRTVVRQGIEDDQLDQLQEYLVEGGVAVSDSTLRDSLAQELETYRGKSRGARGTRQAVAGRKVSGERLVGLLKEVLLDTSVWKVLEDLYRRYLEQKPSPAPLAVLLSIL